MKHFPSLKFVETDEGVKPLLKHSVKIDPRGNFSEFNGMNVVNEESIEEEDVPSKPPSLNNLSRPVSVYVESNFC